MSRKARSVSISLPLALLMAISVMPAQIFVESTSSLFPSPNPTEWTNQVSVGDIDGDGDLDILFANGGGFTTPTQPEKMRVYVNLNGQFKDQTDLRTGGHAGNYRGVEMGDCDNDGDLDVLLAQDFDRLPELLVNDGAGFFTLEGSTRLPAITLSSSRGQFGDVDNDGDMDIFLTDGGSVNRFGCGQYRLYLNDGTCNYVDVTSTQFPLGNVCENMDCIFGDIDADFDIDIRTASTGTNNSRLYRNDGTGRFTRVTGVPTDTTCYSYDFGDIDGDGDLDLVGANGRSGSNAEILLENDGTGSFTDVSSQISPNPNEDDNDTKFLDYDNDGDLDLIVARLGSGGEKIYENDGIGNFTLTSGVIQVVSDSSLDIIVADLDGNGTPEIVTAQGESGNYENRIYTGSGAADTLPPVIVRTEPLADTEDETGPYVVRALILDQITSDRNFFDNGIALHYSVDAGPDQAVAMRHSGGQVYRGELPGQPAGATVEYWVTATDFASNTGIGSVEQFEVLMAAVAAGSVPDGSATPGSPLTLTRSGGSIELTWSASCAASDTDYEVYEGMLGDSSSHVPVVCTTGGALTTTIAPAAGNTFYLVIPRNGTNEGSYGLDGGGFERSPGAAVCVAQSLGGCS